MNRLFSFVIPVFALAAATSRPADSTVVVRPDSVPAVTERAVSNYRRPLPPDEGGPAYAAGEQLKYAISYKAKMWFNTDMGEVTMDVTRDTAGSEPVLKVLAYGKVNGMFRWFFKLDDYYTTWLSQKDGRPVKFQAELREGDYRFSSRFDYDWDKKRVSTRYRNHKNPEESHKLMELTENSMDGLALFYTLRSSDLTVLKPGETRTLELLLEDTVRVIRYKFYGPETKRILGLGNRRTLKFSCQLATSSGESFEDGSEFFIWISDDRNKVPLYMESPIKVGSIRARLVEWSGLKYPESEVFK